MSAHANGAIALDAATKARFDEEDALTLIGEERCDVEGPTADDPLRGLAHLANVAVVGRDRLVELSQREITYVWKPVSSLGWIIMFAGPPGLGKTTTLCMVVVARANTGKPIEVLGLPMEPAPAGTYFVFIEGEVDEIATARKLRATCRMLGVDEVALDRVIVVARKSVRVGDAVWSDVQRLVAAGLVSDIALDSVARVSPAGSDTNDEAAQTALFDMLAKAIDMAPTADTKPVCWLIAHTRKGGSGGLDDVLGSRARTAQIDSLVLLDGEKHNGRVMSVTAVFEKLRHDVDEHPEPVTITIDRDPTTRELRFALGGFVQSAEPLETQIENLLAKHPAGLVKSKIGEELKRNSTDVQEALDSLFAAQRLAGATIKGARGRTYSGVRLRPNLTQTVTSERAHADFTQTHPDESDGAP